MQKMIKEWSEIAQRIQVQVRGKITHSGKEQEFAWGDNENGLGSDCWISEYDATFQINLIHASPPAPPPAVAQINIIKAFSRILCDVLKYSFYHERTISSFPWFNYTSREKILAV